MGTGGGENEGKSNGNQGHSYVFQSQLQEAAAARKEYRDLEVVFLVFGPVRGCWDVVGEGRDLTKGCSVVTYDYVSV